MKIPPKVETCEDGEASAISLRSKWQGMRIDDLAGATILKML